MSKESYRYWATQLGVAGTVVAMMLLAVEIGGQRQAQEWLRVVHTGITLVMIAGFLAVLISRDYLGGVYRILRFIFVLAAVVCFLLQQGDAAYIEGFGWMWLVFLLKSAPIAHKDKNSPQPGPEIGALWPIAFQLFIIALGALAFEARFLTPLVMACILASIDFLALAAGENQKWPRMVAFALTGLACGLNYGLSLWWFVPHAFFVAAAILELAAILYRKEA